MHVTTENKWKEQFSQIQYYESCMLTFSGTEKSQTKIMHFHHNTNTFYNVTTDN